jgi:hypothetical protein
MSGLMIATYKNTCKCRHDDAMTFSASKWCRTKSETVTNCKVLSNGLQNKQLSAG